MHNPPGLSGEPKKQRKTTEKHGKSEEKPKFWTKSAWKGLVRSGEMARKAQRKSLEWEFARKSGGQYGVSKLRGWRKEFYCEFRWRIFSHGWHEYTTRGCSCLCCTNQTATHPTECTEHTEPSAERDSHRWHGWTQMLGCAGIEQRIKPIERVPAAWDFQQRIEPIERIV